MKKKKNQKLLPPLTPKVCLLYISTAQGEIEICRKRASKHNGLAWFCDEHWEKYYERPRRENKKV